MSASDYMPPSDVKVFQETADKDVTLPGKLGKKRTAGLVVNPEIEGTLAAFEDTTDIIKSLSVNW